MSGSVSILECPVTGVELHHDLHGQRCAVPAAERGLRDVSGQVGVGVEEVVPMDEAVLACAHEYAPCRLLYRTALEVLAVVFIQVEQVGGGVYVAPLAVLCTQ